MNIPLYRYIKLLVFPLLFIVSTGFVLDIFGDIANAIRSGEAKAITRFCGNTINLTIINQEDQYSKAQAEQVLRDFFLKNTPRSFNIIHKGVSKEGAKFAIGTMNTAQGGSFRVYFYVRMTTAGESLQEIRFEKE
ncbi:MAG: DUF4783 domain-containing protein [Bacteroidota bacterium]